MIPALVLGFLFLAALGVWQLARYDYKQDLEDRRAAALAAAPLDAAAAAALTPDDLDYRRVRLDGRWDLDRTFTLGNRFRFGLLGEELIVPLLLDGHDAVLVNRGWYPASERDRIVTLLTAGARATVEGLARDLTAGTARQTAAGTWTRLHPPSMAATLPYAVQPWAVVEGRLLDRAPLVPPAELPLQGYTAFDDDVAHLEYAVTWFGLAVALIVTAYFRLWRSRPAPRNDPPTAGH
ncbi:MAG: SURF1 family protein [Dehalococcoidia bacterium]